MQELITAILPIVSIVVTIVNCFLLYRQNMRINNIKTKLPIIEKIFDDYLINRIPDARGYIRFNKLGHLDDYQNYIDVLSAMRNSARYFKYADKSFFDSIKLKTQALEDYLSSCGNKRFESEEQADVYNEISRKTGEIYDCINKYKTC